MNPVINRIQKNFGALDLSLNDSPLRVWPITARIKELGPDFYSKMVSQHLVLHMEYRILCQQLSESIRSEQQINRQAMRDQLVAALILAELLEHIYLNYLNVHREVIRLRDEQKVYRDLLGAMNVFSFKTPPARSKKVLFKHSYAQSLRDKSADFNWYRLFFGRSKRFLDVTAVTLSGANDFKNFVASLHRLIGPIFLFLSWAFFIPRLLLSLFLMGKHLFPSYYMSEEEKALGWKTRFKTQMKRRWFELSNDLVWVVAGILNCFILTGALSPFAICVTLISFAYDIALAVVRYCVESNRLLRLKKEYKEMLLTEGSAAQRAEIENYLKHLEKRLAFERFRVTIPVVMTSIIFAAASCALPFFAACPWVAFVGALCLVLVSLVMVPLNAAVERSRPSERVEKDAGLAKLSFFARNTLPSKASPPAETQELPLHAYTCPL